MSDDRSDPSPPLAPGHVDAAGLWVVVAAYNEAEVIRRVVEGLRSRFPNVIVVDDGSADQTSAEAKAAGGVVLRHPVNLGQGAALATGLEYALRRRAEYIATFDADGQHRPADIQRLLDALLASGADIAVGSRFLSSPTDLRPVRRVVLYLAALLTSWSSGAKVSDATNGLRVFTQRSARRITISQNRMAHATEIFEQAVRHKLRFVEVPVTIDYTEYSIAKGQRISNSLSIVMELIRSRLDR